MVAFDLLDRKRFALPTERLQIATLGDLADSGFHYEFQVAGILEESGLIAESTSPYWWLNSGAYLKIANHRGYTQQGELPTADYFRLLYAITQLTPTPAIIPKIFFV